MAGLAILVTRAVEAWIGLGSAFDRARFPAVGAQGDRIGGDEA